MIFTIAKYLISHPQFTLWRLTCRLPRDRLFRRILVIHILDIGQLMLQRLQLAGLFSVQHRVWNFYWPVNVISLSEAGSNTFETKIIDCLIIRFTSWWIVSLASVSYSLYLYRVVRITITTLRRGLLSAYDASSGPVSISKIYFCLCWGSSFLQITMCLHWENLFNYIVIYWKSSKELIKRENYLLRGV